MNTALILHIFIAALLGGIIGLEREYRAKEAGFRTHFLVALGSALFMVVSQYGFAEILRYPGVSLDPSRIAAQVVSGIGFIAHNGSRPMGNISYRSGLWCWDVYYFNHSYNTGATLFGNHIFHLEPFRITKYRHYFYLSRPRKYSPNYQVAEKRRF